MASRKEQKEQARADRLAAEQAAIADKARKQRLQIFGGVGAIALIAIVVVLVIALNGGNKKKTTTTASTSASDVSANSSGILTTSSNSNDPYEIGLQTGANLATINSQIQATIGGIHQSGQTLGDPKAPVKVLYFGDLQCSACQEFSLTELPAFISTYVRTGKVNITYHSAQTATDSATVFQQQQVAAYSAGVQNKAWDFIERFYHQQGTEGGSYSTIAFWTSIAGQIAGLNLKTWNTDRTTDPNLTDQLSTDATLASKYGVSGTPTLAFIGPKGTQVVSSVDSSTMAAAYKAVE